MIERCKPNMTQKFFGGEHMNLISSIFCSHPCRWVYKDMLNRKCKKCGSKMKLVNFDGFRTFWEYTI